VPALFGEIKYNEPNADPDLLVAPDSIAWPASYPGVSSADVPVTVVATGFDPVTVTDASVTSGQDDVTVDDDECSTLDPGDSCAIYVNFTPAGAGSRSGALTIDTSAGDSPQTVTLAGVGFGGHTAFSLNSQVGDYIGRGTTWSYDPSNATI